MGRRSYFLLAYGIYIAILITVFTFLVPPFRKFDETDHFVRVMTVASGQFACRPGAAGSAPYFLLPKRVFTFVDTLDRGITEKFPVSLYKQRYPFQGDAQTGKTYGCYLPFLGYVPQTLGALASFPWNNLLVTFYFARIGAAVFFLVCFVASLLLSPKRYQAILMLVGALPTVLHQVTIVSYDATVISLSFLAFAMLTRGLEAKKIRFSSFLAFCLIIIYLVLAKPGYYVFALLPLFLVKKLNTPLNKSLLLSTAICLGALSVIYFVRLRVGQLGDDMYLRYQLSVTDPAYFLRVLYTSLTTLQERYVSGVLSTLGWFEYDLPISVVVIYLGLFGFVGYRTIQREKKTLSLAWSLMLLGTVIASILLLFYLFFVYATPVGQSTISGIQGRYFLPFILFGFLAISQIVANIGNKKSLYIGLGLVGVYLLYSITSTIYTRYYDYTGLVSPDASAEASQVPVKDYVLRAPTSHIYPASVGKQIGGFQLQLANGKSSTVSAVYRYAIKDASCATSLQQGILDQERTQGSGVYTEYFPPFPSGERLCVEITPLTLRHPPVFLTVVSDARNVPLVHFLYQLK